MSKVPLPWGESGRQCRWQGAEEEPGQHQEDRTNNRCVATAGALKPPRGPGGNIVGLQKDKLGWWCGSWGDMTYKSKCVLVCQAD